MYLTYTSYAEFKRCRQRWAFNFKSLLSPKKEPEVFTFGKAIHAGLAAFYSGQDAKSAFDQVIKKGSSAYEDEKTSEKTLALGHHMLDRYEEFSKEKDFFVVKKTEFVFNVKIAPEIALLGRVDGIAENDGTWLLEFKTASQVGPAYLDYLQLDEQSTAYIVAIENLWPISVEGVIYTILRKSRAKESIVRKQIVRTEQQKTQFVKEAQIVAEEMERGVIYRNPSHLCLYCPYRLICEENSQELVDFYFNKREVLYPELEV